MRYSLKSILLSGLTLGLLIGSSHALSFDPNEALRQQKARQEAEEEAQRQAREAKQEIEHRAIYERYRNKETARINDNGTVTIGNLQWMRCALGQQWNGTTCIGDASEHNGNDARALPGLMNAQGGFAGYTDWRLPTASELASLRVCSTGRAFGTYDKLPGGVTTFSHCDGKISPPTIDTRLFPGAPLGTAWSGSLSRNPKYAFSVAFVLGAIHGFPMDHHLAHLRLVRSVR